MPFVDVHCHLDQFKDEEIREIIKESEERRVKVIINNGVDKETNRKTLELSRKFKIVKAALGLHPEFIERFSDEYIKDELEFIRKNKSKIIAVGEVGLDFYWIKDEALRKKQESMFREFIQISKEINKPLIVHSRGAERKAIEILKEEKAESVVMHSFGGKLKLLKGIDEMWMFSIPPIIVRSSHFQELVKRLPLNKLLTETDSPFLGPFRGEKNKPYNVALTVNEIAKLKGLNAKEVENNLFMNYLKMFRKTLTRWRGEPV